MDWVCFFIPALWQGATIHSNFFFPSLWDASEFTTLFDKRVQFHPPPAMFRISADSKMEILNSPAGKNHKRNKTERSNL
jgi:hypothetical protein